MPIRRRCLFIGDNHSFPLNSVKLHTIQYNYTAFLQFLQCEFSTLFIAQISSYNKSHWNYGEEIAEKALIYVVLRREIPIIQWVLVLNV